MVLGRHLGGEVALYRRRKGQMAEALVLSKDLEAMQSWRHDKIAKPILTFSASVKRCFMYAYFFLCLSSASIISRFIMENLTGK